MGQTTIVVGFRPLLVPMLSELLPDAAIIIVEDPSLAQRPPIQKAVTDAPNREISPWVYAQPATADAWYHLHRDLDVVAVIPSVEYSLSFAARLAERYRVPGATLGAATLLRDKSLLRTATTAAGIRNPAFRTVASPDEVREFAAAHPGPLILKPSNRQASVGTRIVPDLAELDQAWQEALEQDEAVYVAYQHLPLCMQVEEYISGEEFSVEMLVRGGRALFSNVTGKLLHPGTRPVERGHVVPAQISDELWGTLVEATENLMQVVGFDTGVLHCEWIVDGDRPCLVECTGRLPGDGIVELIQHAWPIELLRRYCVAMMGGTSEPAPTRPSLAAATLFPVTPPGVVTAVEGLAEAAAVPGVYLSGCLVKVGDRVNELRSSWDRVVGAAAAAPTVAEALAAAQAAIDLITVATRPS